MAAPEQQPLSFDIIFTPSPHAHPDAPVAVFSIRTERKCYLVEADGRTPTPHLRPAAVTQVTPPISFSVPLYMLFAPLLWKQRASSMLLSCGFRVGTEAHERLLQHLCDLAPECADEATSLGCHKLHVAVDVRMRIPVVRLPFIRPVATVPPSAPPCRRHMKIKDLREIAPNETCPICFEEYQESTKMVTETPCSHLFHSDCLLPWLMNSTTCPLCRSILQD